MVPLGEHLRSQTCVRLHMCLHDKQRSYINRGISISISINTGKFVNISRIQGQVRRHLFLVNMSSNVLRNTQGYSTESPREFLASS